ncbi:cobalt ABC transporter ATP-binding protein [Mycoplasma ovis str. Michigan]|uniref:Cobalt ABC transporter ATP-binding protein n=1 Tax=Mycoplasma ovis str. Michigan TaxID=1415773 RepID=A0ABM5P0F4_9MOLU|nr:cobalt ABC transporter ATP-binding protein [Mycoplasma ovis str. Michigan]
MPKDELPEWEEKAKEILSELSFPLELVNSSPFKLSGGQKRKVTLAGILILEPKVIVFDEPTLGLDPQSTEQVIELVRELNNKGVTIILVSSNMDFIFESTDQILFLNSGRLQASKPTYLFFRECPKELIKPKVVSFIEKLSSFNSCFEKLWEYQPKNISQLAESINNVVRNFS